ncbi:MAG: DNA translocase FtsK [Muribaculaceae bacterium]|nr:DNA translocase FtsK [Muribaculaceae bacterium]
MVAVNILLIVIWGFVCSTLIMMVYNRIKDFKDRHSTSDGMAQDDEENGPVDDYVDADDELQQNKPKPKDSTPAPVFEADPRKGSAPRSERADDYNAPMQPAQGDEPNKRRDRRRNVDAPPMDEPEMEHGKMADIEAARKPTNPGDPTGEYIHYKFPTLDLLADRTINTNSVDIEEQEENKQRIISTLGNYGITIKSIEVHVGPTVTLFEIVPEDGTRISKIRGLEDDIALSLKAIGIRIIAPMPGRGTIGIEIPNRDPQVVPMRQVLASKAFQESKAKLPMCLGCTVSNEVFVADLTKMPHLLVAGATGKGKSVGLNAIITSLLFKKGPSELKLVLVDPKRVEFSIYAGIEKYFLAMAPGEERAIITDTDRVVHTLNCLVQEMENRYEVLEQVHVRNVQDYNDKWRRELREVRDEHGEKVYHFMPYIVAVVDEFSDMIMTSGKEVETPIVRIAQKARAVGIHMIIATQRPSAQVITGLIKANFPGRVAFAVTALVDSRIILDTGGAQRLIGRGDMLFQVDGETTRLQCPFVDTPEVEKICEFIKEQEDADKNIYHEKTFELPEYVGSGAESGGGGAEAVNPHDRDPLFDQALDLVLRGDTASTSSLQRALQVGFARAGRIMDQMEALGIVGPSTGGKPRKVLVQSRMDVDNILAALG